MSASKDYYKLFQPDLTPKQMLGYGVFGGSYLGDTINEYPKKVKSLSFVSFCLRQIFCYC